eukprot:gene4323-4576_t
MNNGLWAKRPIMYANLGDRGERISASSFAANAHVKRLSFSNLSGCALFANYAGEVDEIHAAKQFLEHFHSQQVVALLGHSKGGCDVILYAAKYGDIPFVINVAGRFDMKQGIAERFGEDVFDRVKAGAVTAVAQRDDQFYIEFQLTQQDLEERFAIDMAEASAAIKHCKVLTIHGTADRVIPVEDGRKFAAQISGSSYVEVAGADHNFRAGPVVVQQLVEAVIEFLQSNLPAPSAAS